MLWPLKKLLLLGQLWHRRNVLPLLLRRRPAKVPLTLKPRRHVRMLQKLEQWPRKAN
jgi:hypothetical protein